jgi:hypothetical protein
VSGRERGQCRCFNLRSQDATTCYNLPGFLFFLVVIFVVFVVVIALGILVKLFIFKDFFVVVFVAWAGIHGGPAWKVTSLLVLELLPPELLRLVLPQRVLRRQWRARLVRQALRRVAWGTSSSNDGRTSGKPRTDSVATGFPPAGPGDPSDRRTAGSESSRPHRSCQRFYSRWR